MSSDNRRGKRPRIKAKVNVNELAITITRNENRKQEVLKKALVDICRRDNIGIGKAKVVLRKELKWACVKREVKSLGEAAGSVLAS